MMNRKKIIRMLLVAGAVILFFISAPQLILSFPGMLFPEKLATERIILCSDRALDRRATSLLDSVSDRLSASGFFTGNKPLRIYLCQDETLTTLLDKISGTPTGAGFHHFSGNIFLFPERIERFKNENKQVLSEERSLLQYSYQQFNLVDLMVHEGFHALHSDTLGIWTFRRKMPSPHWKAEGFAEYYTYLGQKNQDSTYNFHDRVGLYLKHKDQVSLFYFKAALLYEFLAEQRQMDFADIMDDKVTEESAYKALMLWYKGDFH